MPRKFITVLLKLRVTSTIMHANLPVLAPLPVEESDVESGVEDVPSTKAALPENNDEPADAAMKDKENEEEEDEDDDPETLVWAFMNECALLTTAQIYC